MFKFIRNLFKKNEIEDIVDIPEVKESEVDLHETFEGMRKNAEEFAILSSRITELTSNVERMAKERGIVHKFKNSATGEIYEVEVDDHETFNKMMLNKDLHLLFD